MKTKLIRSSLLGLAVLGTLVLASCQATPTAPTSAVTCDKCGTVHFKAAVPASAGSTGKGLITLKDSSRMSCPDCESQVLAMLKSGVATKHVCKSCGGNLSHCTSH